MMFLLYASILTVGLGFTKNPISKSGKMTSIRYSLFSSKEYSNSVGLDQKNHAIQSALIFAQENQTSVDINNKTETKRKKFIGGISAFMYDANTEYQTKQSLSLGYVILNNLYVGADIGAEGLSLVNRIYLGNEANIYFTSKYKGNIEHGRTFKFGIGGELFLNKFLSISIKGLIGDQIKMNADGSAKPIKGIWNNEDKKRYATGFGFISVLFPNWFDTNVLSILEDETFNVEFFIKENNLIYNPLDKRYKQV